LARTRLDLSDELAARVLGGEATLGIADLSDARPAEAPGRPLWLRDRRGVILGTAVADPENGLLRVLSRDAVQTLNEALFRPRVRRAMAWRRGLGLADGRSACRLLNGEGDGVSGFEADLFGPYAVLFVYAWGLLNLGRVLARTLLELPGIEGVVMKVRLKRDPGGGPGAIHQEVVGREPPESLVVHEEDLPFEVHLLSGLNTGLFTDMREHRRGLRRFVAGKRVLNTFAYTCSLSVSAARGGAATVTSVDLSSGVLAWGRENFRLAGLDPESSAYRFEAEDTLRLLEAEAGRRGAYDVVILDPPTYSSARDARFSVRENTPDLVERAAALFPAEEGGMLWVSANTRRGPSILPAVEEGLRRAGRTARMLEVGGLPPDYPTLVGDARARYLQVLLLHVTRRPPWNA